MRVLWVSPHCWPDYELRRHGLMCKSQGGQTVAMYYGAMVLASRERHVHVDIFARYEHGEPVVKDLHPRVRLVRLPLGPTDRYLPKEQFWGPPIEGFVNAVEKWAEHAQCAYDIVHGHYADGWYVANELSIRWNVPLVCSTHSLGKRKRDNARRCGEGDDEALNHKYRFPERIAQEEKALGNADGICQ